VVEYLINKERTIMKNKLAMFVVQIPNPKDTYTVGRNGVFDIHGMEVFSNDTGIFFTPIGKSGRLLNSGFKIPHSALKEIVGKLQEHKVL